MKGWMASCCSSVCAQRFQFHGAASVYIQRSLQAYVSLYLIQLCQNFPSWLRTLTAYCSVVSTVDRHSPPDLVSKATAQALHAWVLPSL
jgi:hypothetical protein